MRISVNYDNGQVFQHFGYTKTFKIYDIEDGKIVNVEMLQSVEGGHGAIPQQLKEHHVDVAICGGLGEGMLKALEAEKIEVCANVTGDVDKAVQDYLQGTLKYSKEAHHCGGHHH